MIPIEVDVLQLLEELNRLGWRDYKIEIETMQPQQVALMEIAAPRESELAEKPF